MFLRWRDGVSAAVVKRSSRCFWSFILFLLRVKQSVCVFLWWYIVRTWLNMVLSEDIFGNWGHFNWPLQIHNAVCVFHSPHSDRNTNDACVHVSAAHSPCVGWGHMLHEAPVDTHMDSHEDICTWRTPMKMREESKKTKLSSDQEAYLLNMSPNTDLTGDKWVSFSDVL